MEMAKNTPHVSDARFFSNADLRAHPGLLPATDQDRENYQRQMTQLCGSNEAPAVLYKGATYGKRIV
jgi:hypothetical protein